MKIVYPQPLFCFLSINSPIFLFYAFLVVHVIDEADIKEFPTNDTLKIHYKRFCLCNDYFSHKIKS
jgi:hypothetical protein